jgi:hypothetical protein
MGLGVFKEVDVMVSSFLEVYSQRKNVSDLIPHPSFG